VRAEAIDLNASGSGILGQHLVNAAWRDCQAGAARIVAERLEQRCCLVGAMARRFQVERDRASYGLAVRSGFYCLCHARADCVRHGASCMSIRCNAHSSARRRP